MCKTQFIRSYLDKIVKTHNFAQCLQKLQIVSAGNGNCKAELVISEEHLNLYGLLHGGFTSTLIDAVSTYALITHEKNNKPGVSLNLDITFMKPALFGELITINARTIRVGKTVGFVSIDITKNEGKDIIVNGTHIKFIGK